MPSDHALDVTLFGAGAFSYRGEPLHGLAAKEVALLAYLAVEARPVPREELFGLLWGPRGASNLRQALYRLRQRPGAEHWLRDGERVELLARCDVRDFEQRARRGELPTLPASSRLLDALVLRRDPEFHEWLAELRTRVERTIERVHLERARALVTAGRLEEAREALLACEHPEAATLLAELASRRALAPRSTLEVPGREREAAELDALLRAGRSCCVVGPTGIGKSHLVRAVVSDALVVEAHPADVHLPHGALARWLRVCAREVAELSEGAQASLAHLAPSALPDVVAAAAPTAGMLAAAERELGRRLASRTVVLDGLEHHDPDSLRALARIVGEALDAGAAWVLVARPVALARPELRASLEDPRVARLELGPLSLAAFRRFAAESPERDALHVLSGGNPQLALAVWRDRDRAHRLAAPTRVGIAARLRACDDETRALLGLLALCDEPLEVDALALALERDPLVVARRMAAAEDEGWLDETGAFASPLVREVVVEELGDAERRWLHARRALALVSMHAAPRRIATAWLAAGRASEATPFTLSAAREALRASAPESAAEALADLPDDLPAELAVEAALLEANVARHRGDPGAEDEALTRAEARAFVSQSDPSLYAVALRRAEERLRTRGAPAARDAASEAAAIATRLGDVEGRAAAFAWLGEVELRAGALERAQECFAAASASRDVAVRVRGLWGLGACAGTRNDFERARALHAEALTAARAAGLVDLAQRLVNGLGATAERCHDYVEAQRRFAEALALAERRGDRDAALGALLNAADVTRKAGRLGDSWQALVQADARLGPDTPPRVTLLLGYRRAAFEAAVGRHAQASTEYRQTRERAHALGDRRLEAVVDVNLALLACEAEGAPLSTLEPHLALLESLQERNVASWARAEGALFAADPRGAEALLEGADDTGPHLRYVVALARARLRGTPPPGPAPFLEAALVGYALDGLDADLGLKRPHREAWRARRRVFRDRFAR